MKLTENTLALLDQFLNAFEQEIGFRPSNVELKSFFKNEAFVDNTNGLEKESFDGTYWAKGIVENNNLKIETTVFYRPDKDLDKYFHQEEEEELKVCELCKESFEYTDDIDESYCQTCFEDELARAEEEKRYAHDEFRNSVL